MSDHRPTTLAVAYATDFGALAHGGISEFVRQVGEFAPSEPITYLGIGSGSPPRPVDRFVSLMEDVPDHGPLNLHYSMALARHLRRVKYRALVVHRPEQAVVAPRGTPIVQVVHGATWNAWRTGRRAFGLAYCASEFLATWRSAITISVDPQGMARPASSMFRKKLAGTRVPASVDFAEHGTGHKRRLVTSCRLVPEKRVELIVQLSAALGWPLTVFGDGPQMSALKDMAARLKCEVDFRGRVDHATLARAYREQGGVFCCASVFEGYPLAVLEAMASGLPVLGLATDGLRQLEPYGVNYASSVEAGEHVVRTGELLRPDVEAVRRDHEPRTVAAQFWASASRAWS